MSTTPYAPVQLDLTVYQGATLAMQFTLYESDGTTVTDLTGYTFRCQGRRSYQSETTEWDLDNGAKGGITVDDAAAGEFTVTLSDTVTAAIDVGASGVWDVEAEDASGTVTRVAQGQWVLDPEVTHA
ncbi:MAG TPA: hypothetical protein VF178_09710 [Gemmatimonadaceae bacterium]